MRIGIYGAGQFVKHVNREIPFIAVDGGILSLIELGIQPTYMIGDFDSVEFNKIKHYDHIIQLPCRKDDADTQVAIKQALELGYDEIELYGVTGGRLDHFFAVCRLLVLYKDVTITIYDDFNKIYLLKPGSHCISKDGYDYISFFAINQSQLTLKGLEYPLDDYCLSYDNPLCLSNEIKNNQCEVINSDYIYCIQAKKGAL